jgi:PAS domain S-box-containing protein
MSSASLSTQRSRSPGVRANLVLLVIACILPVAIAAAFLIVNFYAKGRQQLVDSALTRARSVIAAADRDIAATQLALQALATSRMLQSGDLAGFHARASDMVVKLKADSIVALAPDGQLLLSTLRPYGTPLPNMGKAPLLRQILATREPGVSDLFTGPISGKLIYTVAVPVQRDGAIMMTLNATITPALLSHVLAEQQLPPGWRASIVDRAGRVVTRSHDVDKYAGRALSEEQMLHLRSDDASGFSSQTLDGLDVFVVSSRSPRTGWTAVLGIPEAELTAGLRATLAWLIGISVAALATGLALAWLLGGRIAHSVRALIAPALAVGAGQEPSLPRLHFKEARELGQALHSAAGSMRQAQAQTRESEQRLALAANAAHLGIWVRDLRRNDIWMSDQWRALFGFETGQVVGLPDLLQRVHADDRAAVGHILEQTRQGLPRYDMEYRIELPDGSLRWIGSHGSVEMDSGGRPALVRGVSLDITQRKLAELDLRQKEKEVTHLARVGMLGELSGALAHELNQPLTAILSNAQAAQRFLARQPPELDEVAEILSDIVAEDKRAGDIIQRLRRLFSKHDTPRQQVDANQLVLDVLRLLRNDLIAHGVTITTELAEQPLLLEADVVQLQQVLINVLMNACDAIAALPETGQPGGGAITLHTGPGDGHTAHIRVSDNGPGMPEATLARIFDPFYTTKERGMGLGLSICRNIISAHHGQLWAQNEAGGGASLHIRLPLAQAVVPGQVPAAEASA